MDELLTKVKANLILDHAADDALHSELHHRRCFVRGELPAHPGGNLSERAHAADHGTGCYHAGIPLL